MKADLKAENSLLRGHVYQLELTVKALEETVERSHLAIKDESTAHMKTEAQLSTEREENSRLRVRGDNYRDGGFTTRTRAETAERRLAEAETFVAEIAARPCADPGSVCWAGSACDPCRALALATPSTESDE